MILCILEELFWHVHFVYIASLVCLVYFGNNFLEAICIMQMTVYARGVSVLMPGEEIPTFIAHPAPVPCPPERSTWPFHALLPPQSQLLTPVETQMSISSTN